MSWDTKGKSGPYYYRSVREGGRVRKIYVGRGPRADEAAREVEQRRQAHQAGLEARHREQARTAVAEARLNELQTQLNLLIQAVLLVAGFYKHHGQWRRRQQVREDHHGTSCGY